MAITSESSMYIPENEGPDHWNQGPWRQSEVWEMRIEPLVAFSQSHPWHRDKAHTKECTETITHHFENL
jgi:hypothetical protein